MYIYCEYPRELGFRRPSFAINLPPTSPYLFQNAWCTLVLGGINPQCNRSPIIVVRTSVLDNKWLADVDVAVRVVYGVFV